MALTFGANLTDRVNIGSAAVIDNLNPFTWFMWLNANTITASRVFACKGLSGTNQKLCGFSGGSGNVIVQVTRASVSTQYITNTTPLSSTGTWYCLAVTFDSGAAAGQVVNIYTGTLTSPLTEATYGTATDGSGGVSSDASSNFFWGNRSNFDLPFQGDIAIGMIFNRALSLGELKSLQWRPRMISGCVDFQILGYNGTGSQPDWSGNGNAGTVTGATQSATHVPLPPPFGMEGGWEGAAVSQSGRTTKNTRSNPLGIRSGMGFRMAA